MPRLATKIIAAGVAHANITPSVGFDNMGDYQRLKPAVGVGNALYAKVTGAAGDIKIAVLNEDGSQFRYTNLEDCRRIGTIIAAEAIKVAGGSRRAAPSHLHAQPRRVAGSFALGGGYADEVGRGAFAPEDHGLT